jgi:hypothetical protein
MQHNTSTQSCRICGGPIDPCLHPFGAHLLCKPDDECMHEICEVLWGDPDDDYRLPTCTHDERRRSA